MIAYIAVSSKAEPMPWISRIVKQKAANGMPYGT